jgi:hypothetical protein
MRHMLLTTVAAAALSLGFASAMAQSGPPAGGPPAAAPSAGGGGGPALGGGAGPGPSRPSPATAAPGRSEAAPGPSRGDMATSAPGRSEAAPGRPDMAPGQERAGVGPDRGRAASQPGGEDRSPAGASVDRERGPDRDRQRAEQDRGERDQSAGSERGRDRDRQQAGSERERDRDRQQAGSERERDRDRQQAGSERERDRDRQQAGSERERDRDRQQAGSERDRDRDRRQDRAESDDDDSKGKLASAELSREKRREIREAFFRRDVKRVTDVSFSISVGVTVPPTIEVYEVPPAIVEIVPEYRGYRYAVVRDEIVIIHPQTRRIVEVIDRDLSPSRTASVSGGSLSLTREQRTTITRSLRSDAASAIRVGSTVPACVELSAVPQRIVADVPELRSHRYFVIGEEIAIVDPETRRIVEIIE